MKIEKTTQRFLVGSCLAMLCAFPINAFSKHHSHEPAVNHESLTEAVKNASDHTHSNNINEHNEHGPAVNHESPAEAVQDNHQSQKET